MKKLSFLMLCTFLTVLAAGCAQKSDSEKLKDDMNKAAKKLNDDMKKMVN